MINIETADAGDLIIAMVASQRVIMELEQRLDAEHALLHKINLAIVAKADKLASVVQGCEQNNQIETAVAGSRRRVAK